MLDPAVRDEEAVELVIEMFRHMGMPPRKENEERARLSTDRAFFETWRDVLKLDTATGRRESWQSGGAGVAIL